MDAEGAHLLRGGGGGSQSLTLAPAQDGFVEPEFPKAGHYPFVTHAMVDAKRGAHGIVEITECGRRPAVDRDRAGRIRPPGYDASEPAKICQASADFATRLSTR